MLKKILASPNVASKEWIIRQYDHEVQGGSVIKPLVGVTHDGPGDAAVLRPVLGSAKGVVIACGMNPVLGELDPYQSALHAIDEALRNAVAVGGDLDHTAILDNFCWGNCNKPDRMGALVQSAKACYDAAKAYGTPFVSGKDSLNNEFVTDAGATIAIPRTAKSMKRARSGRGARIAATDTHKNPDDVLTVPALNPMSRERTGYPTQKPVALLEKLIVALCSPDGIVGDFFCGSGTTLVAAKRLGRRFVGCDVSAAAVELARGRLDNHRE